jgi:hypothetical protein
MKIDNIPHKGTATDNNQFSAITINESGAANVILQSHVLAVGGAAASPLPAETRTSIFVCGLVEAKSGALISVRTDGASAQGASDSSHVIRYAGRGVTNSASASTKDIPLRNRQRCIPTLNWLVL